jgi:hypothetical protein
MAEIVSGTANANGDNVAARNGENDPLCTE